MADIIQLTLQGVMGLAIGFVGGVTGLVLGVLRFPLILSTEISAGMAAGTNIGVSTLGACTAASGIFDRTIYTAGSLSSWLPPGLPEHFWGRS